MLAADHRLRESDAFRRTVRSGRRAGGTALVAHLLLSAHPGGHTDATDPGAPAPRVGFVVSKAVGNAVVRNRVKRRLRHLVAAHLGELPAGSELVVRALPPAAAMTSAELDLKLTRSLDRARRVRSGVAT